MILSSLSKKQKNLRNYFSDHFPPSSYQVPHMNHHCQKTSGVNMSDHFKINVQIEIYDEWKLDYEPKGDEIKEHIRAVIVNDLVSLGFDRDQFFVSC